MAIDSQQKRMAAAGAGRPWIRAVFPVATPTAAWRANVGDAYVNALGAPIVKAPVGILQTRPQQYRQLLLMKRWR